MKIIHIVENLDQGAVENWLVNVFLESRKIHPNWEWTFYCILGKKGRLDEIVLEAGGIVIHSPFWISDKISFLSHLRKVLKNNRYDVLHAHHDYLSGYYLMATAGIKFKKKVLQIHNTDKSLPIGSKKLQGLLLGPLRKLAISFSDVIVGISKDTLEEFIGTRSLYKLPTLILYYGIDLKPFSVETDKLKVYEELNIPRSNKVILFVGRMNKLKNPVFIINILDKLNKHRNDITAVFVGKGEQEELILKLAREKGVVDKIRLLGWRNDTALLMKAADIFIFPRIEYPKEGLGLVVVEAQAAGLPLLLSNGIVQDAIVIPSLAHFLPLSDNLDVWAEEADVILNSPAAVSAEEAYRLMQQSKFELKNATENLCALYA